MGFRPRLYYKRSTDANTYTGNTSATDGWKYDEANNATSPFTFNIDFSKLFNGSGVSTGTIIQYFVVAQDIANPANVGINSGTFASAPTTVDLATANLPLAGTTKSFKIVPSFSGVLNVGTSQAITSLTNTNGLFDQLNNGALLGNLTVNITSDLLSETGTVALNQQVEDGGSNYSVTIRPTGAARIVRGTALDIGLIKLNGADRIIIDGSLTGGTDRSLTIHNNATGGNQNSSGIHIASAGTGNGATSNIIKNCIIRCNDAFESGAGIASSNTTGIFTSPTAPNSNNTYQNNQIFGTYYGIYATGPLSVTDQSLTITKNSFGSSAGALKLGGAIYVSTQTNPVITDNTISGVSYSYAANYVAGIEFVTSTGGVITGNKISNIANTSIWRCTRLIHQYKYQHSQFTRRKQYLRKHYVFKQYCYSNCKYECFRHLGRTRWRIQVLLQLYKHAQYCNYIRSCFRNVCVC